MRIKSFPSSRKLSRQIGFTLVEIMVALVISSLLFTVLISSLVFVFRAQVVLSNQVHHGELEHRATAWFQSLISGAVVQNTPNAVSFRGTKNSMEFETQAPLSPLYPGVPRVIRLNLKMTDDNRVDLNYQQATESSMLMVWENAKVNFKYLDQDGKSHVNWPDASDADRTVTDARVLKTDLPAVVLINVDTPAGTVTWVASPRTTLIARPYGGSALGLFDAPKK